MKFPLSWLKEYIKTSKSADEIAEGLTLLGLEVDAVRKEKEDHIFEISLTPNLGHAMSLYGIARELSALTEESLHFPALSVKEEAKLSLKDLVSVQIEAPHAAPRYMCRLLCNVKVGPSPEWLKKRVEAAGFRSVSNVVDVTNYVLLELGHPLHAFDFDTLAGHRIVVRKGHAGETIVTLDGKEHHPTLETLLICDAEKPVAIAGVMGGANSEVSEKTTRVLLEAAYFDPMYIRRASKQTGIQTEGSKRFERGVDVNMTKEALNRAAHLLEAMGAQVATGVIDVYPQTLSLRHLTCRLKHVNDLLGTKLALTEVTTLLKRLELNIKSTKNDCIEVEVPSFRNDIHAEIDLIEEVARLYGYDNIYDEKRSVSFCSSKSEATLYLFEREIRNRLLSEGLQEFLTCDLISPDAAALLSPDCFPSRSLVTLLNPSSQDQSVLRPSMLPPLLKVVKYNFDREKHDVAGFEVGRVHFKAKESFIEPYVAAVVLSGKRTPLQWDGEKEPFDFFDLKGMLENLFAGLKVEAVEWVPSYYETFHPKRQARLLLDSREIGIAGEIHPHILQKLDLPQPVLFAEVNLEDLQQALPEQKKMVPVPLYPSSFRDWTITVLEKLPVATLFKRIDQHKSLRLEEVALLSIYRGGHVGEGKKNITFRFVYRDLEKTLSLAEVDAEHNRLIESVAASL